MGTISKIFVFVLVLASAVLSGCGTRSISNSDYSADSDRGYAQRNNPFYKGELNEFDVIGVDSKSLISDKDIADAAATRTPLSLPKGSSIMLIQSGAMMPDEEMQRDMQAFYSVVVFSGIPADQGGGDGKYSRALRLAAARGGAKHIVVYWGVLETGREDLATKVVSWLPFIGGAIPDETQRMRIRMKVAIVEVKTGAWEIFTPEPFEDSSASGRYSRVSSDQAQVALLKGKAYKSAVSDLVKKYSRQ